MLQRYVHSSFSQEAVNERTPRCERMRRMRRTEDELQLLGFDDLTCLVVAISEGRVMDWSHADNKVH